MYMNIYETLTRKKTKNCEGKKEENKKRRIYRVYSE